MRRLGLASMCLVLAAAWSPPARLVAGDFLVPVYDNLHASPLQTSVRQLAPMPVAAVFIQHPGHTDVEIREHFRTMRRLGFTALTDIRPLPGWEEERIALIALEEGLVPWWYGEAGGEPISRGLSRRLNIDAEAPAADVRNNPRFISHQTGVFRRRAEKLLEARRAGRLPHREAPAFIADLGPPGLELKARPAALFVRWSQLQYGPIEQLNKAYNLEHHGLGDPFVSWDDFAGRWKDLPPRNVCLPRDIFRFQADRRIQRTREWIAELKAFDPKIPFRAGGELGMFSSTPYWGVHLEGVADALKEAGAFCPSMHLAWHFHEVDHEITRPAYMQAALAADLFKGGWTVAWDTSGGPQQTGGGKEGDVFTVDGGVMGQLMLSQLAGGLRGFELWCWNVRSAGAEAGEYGLVDRHGKVTPRAVRAGQIGQAARRHRDELWAARKEPVVGIYFDWENDAVWAAMSIEGREQFRHFPMQARVGVSRALINANVPFEYVTVDDLAAGLAGRYQIIYLPAILALREATLFRLRQYVRDGGRVVIDMPGAWYNDTAALMSTDQGTEFETLFGTVIDDFQGAGVNRRYSIDGMEVTGFVIDTTPTRARVLARYGNGRPAITAAEFGEGTAVVLGYEASRMCFWQGTRRAQQMLLRYALEERGSPYTCEAEFVQKPGDGPAPRRAARPPIVYRLAAPTADHYFLINDGPAVMATLKTVFKYRAIRDAVTGQPFKISDPVEVAGYDARWLRAVK